ncbi:MAG: DHHW family protein [Eggerthellaceae bacterium]
MSNYRNPNDPRNPNRHESERTSASARNRAERNHRAQDASPSRNRTGSTASEQRRLAAERRAAAVSRNRTALPPRNQQSASPERENRHKAHSTERVRTRQGRTQKTEGTQLEQRRQRPSYGRSLDRDNHKTAHAPRTGDDGGSLNPSAHTGNRADRRHAARTAFESASDRHTRRDAETAKRPAPRRGTDNRITQESGLSADSARQDGGAQGAPRRTIATRSETDQRKPSTRTQDAVALAAGKKRPSAGARAAGPKDARPTALAEAGSKISKSAGSLKSSFLAWANAGKVDPSGQNTQDAPRKPKKSEQPAPDLVLETGKMEELSRWHRGASAAFGLILTLGMVLGLCLFLRPTVSQAENRELSKFPSFNVADFVSGAYTEQISTWYADTYPFRDQLIAVNQAFKGLYGFESSTQMFGNAVQGDDIPDEGAKSSQKKDPVAPETYDSFNLEEDIQGQIMQGLYVDNGAVYATYGFTQEAADDYVNAVNGAADKLEGITQVYSILIPNNSGVLLSKDELAALGGSNQGQAIQYYYDSYNDKVKTVPTMQPLVDHKDEYLFFRTDHHWTALGAYYVYQSFCNQKGIDPHNIEDFKEEDFSPFLGSYYSQLQLESLTKDPDTVQAWVPNGTNDMKYTDVDGQTIDWNVIKDVSDWDEGTQYNCFVGGDQPWAEIHNPEITDGSSCLVIKESYGNAFIPWLVDHYQDVYIVDFRYNNDNVVDICKEKEVDDLILLNNISIIGSVEVAGKIASLL